ncbi:MAG: hypothetical protein LBR37_00720 [Erysipelotrichaceae bacterium]|jgi:hypothetical protein|nr:hypothetical protein [Erysipelotrichaceae bacterium]
MSISEILLVVIGCLSLVHTIIVTFISYRSSKEQEKRRRKELLALRREEVYCDMIDCLEYIQCWLSQEVPVYNMLEKDPDINLRFKKLKSRFRVYNYNNNIDLYMLLATMEHVLTMNSLK